MTRLATCNICGFQMPLPWDPAGAAIMQQHVQDHKRAGDTVAAKEGSS